MGAAEGTKMDDDFVEMERVLINLNERYTKRSSYDLVLCRKRTLLTSLWRNSK